MRPLFFTASLYFRKYRGEVIIASISFALSIVTAILLKIIFDYKDPYLLFKYTFGILIILLVSGILFNQKRLAENRFRVLTQILTDQFSFSTEDNQFFWRRGHYSPEKTLLSRILVRHVLQDMVKSVYDENVNLTKLNIIIDSGTTLTPIFPELLSFGIPRKDEVAVEIYTNSMSGTDEIHKAGNNPNFALSERDFNLIGGQPLTKYRATTGDVTQDFLRSLWSQYEDSDEKIVTLSILTANWFLAGHGLNQLSICARGAGHFEFKRAVYANSHYVIAVAPLGKILRLDDVSQLNALLKGYEEDTYKGFLLDVEKKDRTFLLTTHRDTDSKSLLINLSIQLQNIGKDNRGLNFVLHNASPKFKPPGDTKGEVFIYETPHRYIRKNVNRAYGVPHSFLKL